MRSLVRFAVLFLNLIPLSVDAAADVLSNLTSVNSACSDFVHNAAFALTSKVEYVSRPETNQVSLHVRSAESWSTLILSTNDFHRAPIREGDTIFVRGFLREAEPTPDKPIITNLVVLAQGTPSPPLVVPLTGVFDNRYSHAIIRISGLVTDVFEDEIDGRFIWLRLTDGQTTVYVSAQASESFGRSLVGAQISAPAEVMIRTDSLRLKIIHHLYIIDTARLRITQPPPDDPFSAPWRTLRKGRVIAVWQGRNALLQPPPAAKSASHCFRVEFADGPLPAFGDFIDVAGESATDFYAENLSRAIWRPTEAWEHPAENPQDTDPRSIMEFGWRGMGNVRSGINPQFHGQAIRLTGRILDKANRDGRLYMDCSGLTIPVDLSAVRQTQDLLAPGCRAAISGICVMDIPNWTPGGPFPKITGFTLVVRDASEVVILAQPPWWTPFRFLCAVGALVTLVILILIWNASLRLLVTRRSRQLVREQTQKLGAELRLDERTRLAAELHDSVAQNLSGVSMQLDAIQMSVSDLNEPFKSALVLASKTLLSCRQELRNCLWDLRSQALDEPDLGIAVLKTLTPHLNGSRLHVRFNVPRRLVSDQTAHAILRILRELAANALHHGRAKKLTVAGCLDGRLLRFSLTDNGIGFDPHSVEGVESGHFGLSGIRDRVNKMHGTFEIHSDPRRGTKAVITLNAQ